MHQEMKVPNPVSYVKCGLFVDPNSIYYIKTSISDYKVLGLELRLGKEGGGHAKCVPGVIRGILQSFIINIQSNTDH